MLYPVYFVIVSNTYEFLGKGNQFYMPLICCYVCRCVNSFEYFHDCVDEI